MTAVKKSTKTEPQPPPFINKEGAKNIGESWVPKKRPVVLTYGGAWADMFEQSLSRKMGQIEHLALGKPWFKLSRKTYDTYMKSFPSDIHFNQVIAPSKQPSAFILKLEAYCHMASLILVDNSVLDTAVGQWLLQYGVSIQTPVYGVGTTEVLSPLAPHYLEGVVFPKTGDELVQLALRGHFEQATP